MPTLYLLDAYALIYRAYYAFINRPLVDAQGRDTSALYLSLIHISEPTRRS